MPLARSGEPGVRVLPELDRLVESALPPRSIREALEITGRQIAPVGARESVVRLAPRMARCGLSCGVKRVDYLGHGRAFIVTSTLLQRQSPKSRVRLQAALGRELSHGA